MRVVIAVGWLATTSARAESFDLEKLKTKFTTTLERRADGTIGFEVLAHGH